MIEAEEERHLKSHPQYIQSNEDPFKPYFIYTPNKNPPQRSSKCPVYTLLVVVLLSVFSLIFSIVVLRAHPPSLRLSNVVVRDLRHTPSSLNATLLAEMRLHNANYGRFSYRAGNATLLFGNATIGAAIIADGFVRRRESRWFNVTVTVSYREPSDNFSAGLIELRGSAKLRGQVRVVRIVRSWRTAVMNCTLGLNLTSRAIHDLYCQ